ncbi:MAG: choice-of-anchor J domain-containing protein, partial [Bacteroidetes bacterium]|nr:choice-of-anchor J domain-containing protein [Bacteroidota bacterium]
MRKTLLLLTFLLGACTLRAQVLLSESFDNSTFPPTGWSVVNASTNYNYISGPLGWDRIGSAGGNYPTPNTHSGSGMAWMDCYWIYPGTSDLYTPSMNFTASGNKVVKFWLYNYNSGWSSDNVSVYVNTTNSLTGATLLASIYPNNASSQAWAQYSYNIPSSFNGATNYIIFEGISDFGYDMYMDDVEVINYPPCTGVPNAGTAYTNPNPVCANQSFLLIDTGYTVASGLTMQWQKSAHSANVWSNITGATTATYNYSTGITASTDFRFIITCTASGGKDTSNVFVANLDSFINCYCIPTYNNGGGGDNIIQVDYGTMTNNTASAGNPSPYYHSYFSQQPSPIAIPKIIAGQANNLKVKFGSDGNQYSGAWIDDNHDGIFGSSEFYTTNSNAGSGGTATISVTIPTTAATGITGLRVRGGDDVQPSNNQACGASNSTWGEAEDYLINILSPKPPAPIVSNNGPVCPFGTLVITALDSVTGYNGRTFSLSGPFSGSPITGDTTGIFTITNMTAANAGTYTVTITNGAFVSNPTTTTVVVYPTPTAIATTNIVTPSSCLSGNGSFTITGLEPNKSYVLRYRMGAVNQTPVNITSNAAGNYVLAGLNPGIYDSIRVTSLAPSNCTSNYITTQTIVPAPNPPPTPVINATNPVCPGSTLSLSVSNVLAGATYSWLAPNPLVNPLSTSGATATRTNMSNALDGVYSAKVTVTATGCSSIGTVSVTTSQPDPKPLTFRRTYCQYETPVPIVAQTTIPGAVLTYYTVPIGGVGSTTAPTPSTLVPGVTKYYVSQTKTCESLRDTVYILVNPTPLPPTTNNAKLEYCQYETASPLSASGTNILWFTTPTGGTGSATAPTPSTLVPGTYHFYASQTSNYLGGHSCESNRLMFTVVVKPKPAPPGVTSPFNLCQGDPIVPLTAVGQNLLWYTVANGGVGVPVAPLPNTGYEDSFQYYVTQTVLGCESDRALMKVIVNYKPNGILSASTYNVCQGEIDSFFYFGNARPDAEYNWYASITATFLSGKGTRGPVVISFDTSGTSYVRLTIDNKGCISDLITAPITVRPLPKFNFVQPQDACENQLVNIGLNYHDEGITG